MNAQTGLEEGAGERGWAGAPKVGWTGVGPDHRAGGKLGQSKAKP
jgi:hypothetical protein